MVDFPVVPERTAHVNVDMQNCFVHGSAFSAPDRLAVQDRINRVAAACRAAGIVVIHTSHVLRLDGSNIGVLGEIALVVKKGIINKGSESAALHKELVVDARDILLEKPRFGAFHGTDLELILRSRHRHHYRNGHRRQRLLRNNCARGQRPRFSCVFPERRDYNLRHWRRLSGRAKTSHVRHSGLYIRSGVNCR